MKSRRLSAIRHVVQQDPVHSQEELRQRLARMGFVVTQATLSRDIKELGLVKRASDGAYSAGVGDNGSSAAATVALSRALSEFLLGAETAQQLVVVKTGPGQAQLLGLAIDRARLQDVVGTIAGDDTILVVAREATGGAELATKLAGWAGRETLAGSAGRDAFERSTTP
jgi:transcriptional regulator of arginine metabolism